jgi:hypothetical protein
MDHQWAVDYNRKFADIPETQKTEITLDDDQKMLELVTSYVHWIWTHDEVGLQQAAHDPSILVHGYTISPDVKENIVTKMAELRENLKQSVFKDIDETNLWYSVVDGDGGDILMCSKDKSGKYKLSLSGLKIMEENLEPEIPILSFRTQCWLRDSGLLAPSKITSAQMQRVFTAPDSFLGGKDSDKTVQYDTFVTKNGQTIKVLHPPEDYDARVN